MSLADTLYGNPRGKNGGANPAWEAANLVTVDVPFTLRIAGTDKTTKRITCHKRVARQTVAALTAVWNYARLEVKKQAGYNRTTQEYDNLTHAYLAERGLDIYGGCYCYRNVRGGSTLSYHAYAAADDWDPQHNPLGKVGRIAKTCMWWVRIWQAHGFVWGGSFSRKDGMHVECHDPWD